MEILLATTNPGKLRELSALFANDAHTTFALAPALEVEETGETFEANARLKAEATMRLTRKPCLADDSGLVVDALGGRPGVYSARYADGDAARIAKLLGELEGVSEDERGAAFVCAMVLALPDGRSIAVEGRCEGRILTAPRGVGGFGYDPIFGLLDRGLSMAELDPAEKNRISHRAKAAQQLASAISGLDNHRL